ncbi:hypothetical protein T01_9151 [Trichinella spiralis]|uniref:Uncharacterized protein n=1 Tax=Trichinella spiralis TaxID=6334 RepID=A0A0V1BG04_TRISP|nr:hypothetical protein T01_9151 [Trichinella spiralis]
METDGMDMIAPPSAPLIDIILCEGVIIIEAFSNSCRSGQHGVSSLHQCVLNVASENKYCQYSRIALMPVYILQIW